MNNSAKVEDILVYSLFCEEEISDPGKVPDSAVVAHGIARSFGFHPERLEEKRGELLKVLGEVVPDDFKKSGGGGGSFLSFCIDREGRHWAEHPTMEALFCLANALGLAGYCAPKEMWAMLPGGVPYIWFDF